MVCLLVGLTDYEPCKITEAAHDDLEENEDLITRLDAEDGKIVVTF